MDERRKFERVNIPEAANIYAEDRSGRRLGTVRMLGRGGLLIESQERFTQGERSNLVLVDEAEGIRRELSAVVRYAVSGRVGFEFENLDADAGVEIGVIIGKHYTRPAGAS